jgi:hypothetical protein
MNHSKRRRRRRKEEGEEEEEEEEGGSLIDVKEPSAVASQIRARHWWHGMLR